MVAPSCPECGGTRWARYFSETTDGNFEEAFKLCPCNHKSLSDDHPGYRAEKRQKDVQPKLPNRPTPA